MVPNRLLPPEPIDLVPSDEVERIISTTDDELAELDREAVAALAAADEAEAWMRSAQVDEQSSTWAMVRLQRFLAALREEAERDSHTVVELAERRAEFRLAEARAEAARIRERRAGGIGSGWSEPMLESGPAHNGTEPAAKHDADDHVEADPHTPNVVSERAEPNPSPVGAPPAFVAAAAPVAPPADVGEASGNLGIVDPMVDDPAPPPPAPAPVVATDTSEIRWAPGSGTPAPPASPINDAAPATAVVPESTSTPLVAPVVFTDAAVPPPPAPGATAGDGAFWTEPEPAAGRRSGRGREKKRANKAEAPAPAKRRAFRLPLSAILEVIAVLLILVFVLLRLS